jgi:hypothetical protein
VTLSRVYVRRMSIAGFPLTWFILAETLSEHLARTPPAIP